MKRKNLVVIITLLLLLVLVGSDAFATLPTPSSGKYTMTIKATVDGEVVKGATYRISLIKTIDSYGVVHEVASPDSVEITSTGNSGVVLHSDFAGIYRIEETVRAPGFLPYDKVLEVELSDAQKQVNIHPKMSRVLGSLRLKLWGEPAHIALKGATFQLEKQQVDGSGNVSYAPVDATTYTTDINGFTATISGVREGVYRYVQTSPSTDGGYLMNTEPEDPFAITPADAGQLKTVEAVNTKKLGTKLILTLQDRDDASIIIPDAVFRFERIVTTGGVESYVPYGGQYITDANGQVKIDHIPVGKYRFVQVSSAHGYMRNLTPEAAFEITPALEGKTKEVIAKNTKMAKADVVLTLQDKNDSSIIIPGATFELYKTKDEHGQPITPVKLGNYTTDVNGQIEILTMPQGSYQFVQKTSTGGYISNTTPEPEFSITKADDGKVKQLIAKNEKKPVGSVTLTLVDKADHSVVIPGSTFDLIKTVDAAGNAVPPTVVGSYVTDGSGQVVIPALADGVYHFVQTTATGDYIMNTTPEPDFTIAGNHVDVLAENVKKTIGSVTLTLVDKVDHSVVIPGAIFELVQTEDEMGNAIAPTIIGSYVTDSAGKINIPALADGTYHFMQKTTTGEYIKNEVAEPPFEVRGKHVEVLAENVKKTIGSVTLTLVDQADHSVVLPGASFELIKSKDAAGNPISPQLVGSYVTDTAGQITVAPLDDGTYYFVQKTTAEGYIKNETPEAPFEVRGKHVEVLAENPKPQVGAVTLTLVDKNNHAITIDGAIFELVQTEDKDGNAIAPKVIGSYVTDGSGQIAIDPLPDGVYHFVQKTSSNGYIKNEVPEASFTVKGKPVAVLAENVKEQVGAVTLVLVDKADHAIKIGGAVFELIQTKDASGKAIAPKVIGNYVTDGSGKISVTPLADGVYHFMQKTTAAGYIKNETPEPDFTIKGKHVSVLAENVKEKVGSVELTLVDRDDHSIKIGDAIFELVQTEDKAGNPITPKVIGSYITDKKGQIKIASLADGTYYFVQKTTTGDYIKNTTAEPPFKMRGGLVKVLVENYKKAAETTTAAETEARTTEREREDDDLTTLKVTLIGKPADELLAGAEFVVERIANASGDPITPQRIGGVHVTGETGKFYVNKLIPGEYRIVQLTSVDGYAPSDKEYLFSVTDRDAGRMISKVVENYKKEEVVAVAPTTVAPPIVTDDGGEPLTNWVFPRTGELPIYQIMIGIGLLMILIFVVLLVNNNKEKTALAGAGGTLTATTPEATMGAQAHQSSAAASTTAAAAGGAGLAAVAADEPAPEVEVTAAEAARFTPVVAEAAVAEPVAVEETPVEAVIAAVATDAALDETSAEEVQPAVAGGDAQPPLAPVVTVDAVEPPAIQSEVQRETSMLKKLLIGAGVAGVALTVAYVLWRKNRKK